MNGSSFSAQSLIYTVVIQKLIHYMTKSFFPPTSKLFANNICINLNAIACEAINS